MRDIRPDLRERLESIARERARLDQMELGIKALLELEDRAGFTSPNNGNGHSASLSETGTPLTRLIIGTLHQAKRALTVDDFKAAASNAGFDFGNKSPGRVLHWALVGMGDAVEKVGGKWQLKEATQ